MVVCKIVRMFDNEHYKNATMKFISYLRTLTTQKKLAFFCDISREYVRKLENGAGIPSVKTFFNMIDAAGLNLDYGSKKFIEFLNESKISVAADKKLALKYVHLAQINKTQKIKTAEQAATKTASTIEHHK